MKFGVVTFPGSNCDVDMVHVLEAPFQQALEPGAPAGPTTLAANSARRLAFEHFTVNHDVNRALAILQQHEPLIRMVAVESALALYTRGVCAQERGELSAAVRYLAQAGAAAHDLDDDETRRLIRTVQALVLAQQGLTPAAETVLKELLGELDRPGGGWDACERMTYLNILGWVRILEQESRSPGAQDPLPLLTAALQYRAEDGCAADGQNVRMNQSRAELLIAERLAEASPSAREALASPAVAQHLLAAREHLLAGLVSDAEQLLSQQMDAAEVSGRIAYLQSRFPEALGRFAELARLAALTQEPDYQFRALLGQALVNAALARTAPAAASYPEAALAAFSQAQALLDERLWRVPLTATRRAFLPRFTAGTAEFLGFLLSRGETRRALEVARRAQVRGLVTALSFDTLTLLPEPQRSRLMAARAEVVRRSEELKGQPEAGAAGRAALTQQLTSLLADLHDAGLSRLALRELQPGEALHGHGLTFWGGYGFIPSFVAGTTDPPRFEHRIWEQFIVNEKVKTVALQGRIRAEQRFRDGVDGVGQRLRIFGRAGFFFGQQSSWGWAIWDELLINLNETNAWPIGFDQNRFFTGPFVQAQNGVRVEFGYFNFLVNRRDTGLYDSHIAMMNLFIPVKAFQKPAPPRPAEPLPPPAPAPVDGSPPAPGSLDPAPPAVSPPAPSGTPEVRPEPAGAATTSPNVASDLWDAPG